MPRAASIRFAATGGTLALTRADIVDVRDVPKSSVRQGEVWPANPNATRLFFAPTGRMLAKGEGTSTTHISFFSASRAG